MLAQATSIARPNLISLGTCMGKFSKSGKFKLGVTCLDWLAKYAKYKVCCSLAKRRVTRVVGCGGFSISSDQGQQMIRERVARVVGRRYGREERRVHETRQL